MTLPIIFQDQHMVVINKPAGLLVHRSMLDKHATEFAMQMLRDQINQHVFPVHRLDRPTSGLLVFALSSEVASVLTEQFSQQQVQKHYLAIVRGYAPDEGELDYALKEELDKIADKKARQDKEPQQAVTYYKKLAQVELPFAVGRYQTARYSLMALSPKTGRKHQLRRHMAHLRHPIVGDTTHGDGKQNRFIRDQYQTSGLALSCIGLSLLHPVTHEQITLTAPPSEGIQSLCAQWGWQPYTQQ
ncbi:tRNA pseudouridine(65) synthase TruC [Neptunicella marina]|uniref:tRNA pseudouridine synthase C n=1 Tax=Neptunicella marina TaxID=2125989 RepID=A0A8J6ISQ7_9ALTE|nr:tRNA pseudouridine(65) synthase TruC [Neptunicella marina]MBC3764898.1 tRNA pseudouridine(65) synthase TruC [Neptunicella marina]